MGEKSASRPPGSEHLYDALVEAGVELLVGLPGTQTLPVDREVAERDDVDYVMARHETAIPHIAWGYYESSHRVAATITVPGPGDTNAAHGLKNALDDHVPIVHVSPIPDHEDFGRHPIHELEHDTLDNVVKANLTVPSPTRLREVIDRGIETALTPPRGPVRLGIPKSYLAESVDSPDADVAVDRATYAVDDAVADAAALLANAERPLVYVGGGARRSPDGPEAVSELVARLNAPVVATYKGKGVFPEDDDRFLGVSGSDLPAGAVAALDAADVVLALGTNFDGPNTRDWALPMGERLVHVDLDPSEIGAAYDPDVAVVGDVGRVGESLATALEGRRLASAWDGGALGAAVREEYVSHLREHGLLDEGPPVSTPAVLRTVREVVPREAVVTTDIGGHRIWSKNAFPAYEPTGFVTPGSWAGMGVGLPSAIGARLANPDRPVVVLSGDGSLLMCAQELHTAAEANLDLTVVLFNDSDYGIISKSMDAGDGRRFAWNSPDWTAIAAGFGCEARSAHTRAAVGDAVQWALDADGPSLVDVAIDPEEPTATEIGARSSELDPASF